MAPRAESAVGPTCPCVASRAEASALGGPTRAVGPPSGLVWPHVPDVNVDRWAIVPLEDSVGLVRTSDIARWPIADQKNG